MTRHPEGLIEDNAMRAVDLLTEMDPREVDLETLLALRLKIHAFMTKAYQAQMKVAAE